MAHWEDETRKMRATQLVRSSSHAASTGPRHAAPAGASRPNAYPAHSAAVRPADGSRGESRRAARARARYEAELRRKRRRMVLVAAVALVAVVVAVGAAVLWGRTSRTPAGENPVPEPSAPSTPEVPEVTLTEAEQRIEEVRARASVNATREQPSSLTDPADYAELGRATMEAIAATCSSWESFDNAAYFSLDARTSWDGGVAPYLLAVNRAANVVTVYTLDADNRYTVPYQAMICSTGDYTPIGFYTTDDKYGWRPLFQEVYGQYATHIVNDILFHSVPYYNPYKDDVEYAEFNKLGTSASLGCVRLQVCDVKWIFDNCPLGTPVVIYDDASSPGPMGRPGTIATSETDEDTTSATYRGFDPTDPDDANPWDDAFRSGTAIRSGAAQADWDAAQADGRWSGTINPTDLLGYSTNAESRG